MAEIITLVICTLGRTDQLRRLLVSLRGQTEKPLQRHHRGSEPARLSRRRSWPISPISRSFMSRSALGASRARNAGIALAETPLIGFPDDDCWYAPTTVAEVVRRFRKRAGHGCADGPHCRCRRPRVGQPASAAKAQPVTRANVFLMGNTNTFFARMKAVNAVNGFDETLGVGAGTLFGSGEETDFLLRCLGAGFDVRYERDFLVHHDQVTARSGEGRTLFRRLRPRRPPASTGRRIPRCAGRAGRGPILAFLDHREYRPGAIALDLDQGMSGRLRRRARQAGVWARDGE